MPCDDVCGRARAMFDPRRLTVVPPPGAKNRAARKVCTAQRSKGDEKEFSLKDFGGFFFSKLFLF